MPIEAAKIEDPMITPMASMAFILGTRATMFRGHDGNHNIIGIKAELAVSKNIPGSDI